MKNILICTTLVLFWTNSSLTSAIDIPCYYSNRSNYSTNIKSYMKTPDKFECYITKKIEAKTRGIVVQSIKEVNVINNYRPKSFEDISALTIVLMLIKYMPSGIGKLLPKLLVLTVSTCELKEIKQADLTEFPYLRLLDLSTNEIEVLEPDLFKFNPNLEVVNFNANNIKKIDGNVFNDLKFLKFLMLAANACITKSGGKIQETIKHIKKDCSGAADEAQNYDKKNSKKIKIDVSHGTKYWIFVGFGVVACVIVGGGLAMLVYRIMKPRAI